MVQERRAGSGAETLGTVMILGGVFTPVFAGFEETIFPAGIVGILGLVVFVIGRLR